MRRSRFNWQNANNWSSSRVTSGASLSAIVGFQLSIPASETTMFVLRLLQDHTLSSGALAVSFQIQCTACTTALAGYVECQCSPIGSHWAPAGSGTRKTSSVISSCSDTWSVQAATSCQIPSATSSAFFPVSDQPEADAVKRSNPNISLESPPSADLRGASGNPSELTTTTSPGSRPTTNSV